MLPSLRSTRCGVSRMCSCTTNKCAGCACGCWHTPATRRAFWQGVYAAYDAVAAQREYALRDAFLAAIDALKEQP